MKVYRYASIDEVNLILNGETLKVGKKFVRNRCNSHKYNPHKKYLHFFKNLESIKEIKRIKGSQRVNYCICEYDIPFIVLMLGRGHGFYHPKGYKELVTSHVEYIVPNEVLKSCWLKQYKLEIETLKENKSTNTI